MAELANVSQVEELRCYHASHSVVKPTEIGSSHGRVPFLEGIEDIQWLLLTSLMLKENNTILQNCVRSVAWTGHRLLLHSSIVVGEKIVVNSNNIKL